VLLLGQVVLLQVVLLQTVLLWGILLQKVVGDLYSVSSFVV
jgi:hypothetical protein